MTKRVKLTAQECRVRSAKYRAMQKVAIADMRDPRLLSFLHDEVRRVVARTGQLALTFEHVAESIEARAR